MEPEWKEHDGSAVCPVPAGHDVEVRFTDRDTDRDRTPEEWAWERMAYGRSITHYRDWTAWEQSKMAKADDVFENPQAFPAVEPRDPSFAYSTPGMTLRDWFAGQALVEVASLIQVRNPGTYDVVAGLAYDLADAMLRARSFTLDSKGEG